MIADPGEAQRLAQAILSDVQLYGGGRPIAADSAEVAEARALFHGKVSPNLHGVFETVLANPPAVPPERKRDVRTNLIGLAFLALLAGIGWLAYDRVLGPGQARMTQTLDTWVRDARNGRATNPTQSGASTAAAMVAVSTSTSHRTTRDRGSFQFSGTGSTCFEVELTGPEGLKPIIVRISDDSGTPHVTHVGLRPPCGCGGSGQATSCE